MSSLSTLFSKLHLHFFVRTIHKVQLSIHSLFGRIYNMQRYVNVQSFAVEVSHLNVSVYDRRAEFEHRSICKSLKDKFVAHAIGVTLADANTNKACISPRIRIIRWY